MGLIPGWEDAQEKGMATHSIIPAWRIPWTEETGGLQSTSSKRVGHDWATWHINTSHKVSTQGSKMVSVERKWTVSLLRFSFWAAKHFASLIEVSHKGQLRFKGGGETPSWWGIGNSNGKGCAYRDWRKLEPYFGTFYRQLEWCCKSENQRILLSWVKPSDGLLHAATEIKTHSPAALRDLVPANLFSVIPHPYPSFTVLSSPWASVYLLDAPSSFHPQELFFWNVIL